LPAQPQDPVPGMAPPPVVAVPALPQETPAAVDTRPEVTPEPGVMPEPAVTPEPESAPPALPAEPAAEAAPEATPVPASTDAAGAAESAARAADVPALAAARGAFWARDFAQAEQLYRQLAADYPAASEPVGELGNMYFTQGRWHDAAAAYGDAVERLARAGDVPRAWRLLRVLHDLDPARAQAIRESGMVGGG
ncbi:MAG TPA: tetratricopeptide repeat protein, partial [Gammaproteobacteria bacterium]